MKTVKYMFLFWVITMFLVTFTCLLTYVITQQALRLGANEQPVRLAVETSIKLENGQKAGDAVSAGIIDISKSLNAFIMIFDKDKNLVASSGKMGNNDPAYPKGVLSNIDKVGEERVTWQPQAGLRFATIAVKAGDYYVVAGQSLQETEILIGTVGRLVFLAWLACLIFSVISCGIIFIFIKKVFKMNNF
ncbi:MAG: hypothetical protein NTV16_03075 [Actinobacteria bacterium]|nr:hypothetical protein [Actinomycetota bacterium]